jgi:hypothetical protein
MVTTIHQWTEAYPMAVTRTDLLINILDESFNGTIYTLKYPPEFT